MLSFLNGKKTYLIALATVLYGIVGWYLGYLDQSAAMAMIFGGAGLGALRHGVSKGGTGAALFLAIGVSVALSACGLTPAQVQTDVSTGIAALCLDAANTAKVVPTSPVAVYAVAACPAGIAAATLVQNSATAEWLTDIIGQMKAANAPAPAKAS